MDSILRVRNSDGKIIDIPVIKGRDGTSVSITSITSSTEDGGSNVVIFSDGQTLVIKNGEKGNSFTYEDFTLEQLEALRGSDGKTPVKGVDYFTEEDKSKFVDDILTALPTWSGGVY